MVGEGGLGPHLCLRDSSGKDPGSVVMGQLSIGLLIGQVGTYVEFEGIAAVGLGTAEENTTSGGMDLVVPQAASSSVTETLSRSSVRTIRTRHSLADSFPLSGPGL